MPKQLDIALRAALTLAFLYFGGRKLISHPLDVAIYEAIGKGQWPRFITGSVEVLAAGLLWAVPWAGAALIIATMAVGTSALVLFTDLPFWHLPALAALAALVLWQHRRAVPLP